MSVEAQTAAIYTPRAGSDSDLDLVPARSPRDAPEICADR